MKSWPDEMVMTCWCRWKWIGENLGYYTYKPKRWFYIELTNNLGFNYWVDLKPKQDFTMG